MCLVLEIERTERSTWSNYNKYFVDILYAQPNFRVVTTKYLITTTKNFEYEYQIALISFNQALQLPVKLKE